IACADVDQLALQIERRRRPDRAASGAVHLRPGGILLERLGLQLNRETLPEYFSGVSVERQKAAAESAAFVFGVTPGGLFERRDRHVEAVAIKDWRAGDAGEEMVFDLSLPEQLAGVGVQRLDVRFLVAEIDRVFGLRSGGQRAYADGGAHRRARLHCPIGTA